MRSWGKCSKKGHQNQCTKKFLPTSSSGSHPELPPPSPMRILYKNCPTGFHHGWGTLQTGVCNSRYPVLTLQCTLEVEAGVGVCGWGWEGRKFVLRVPKSQDHREPMNRNSSPWVPEPWAGWILGLTSMRQGRVFYGRVKGRVMLRGMGQLRDYYVLAIAHFLFFLCTHWDYIF